MKSPPHPPTRSLSIACVQTFINCIVKQEERGSRGPRGFHISKLLSDLRSFLIIAPLWADSFIAQALQVPCGNASQPLAPFSTPSHPQNIPCSVNAVREDIFGGFLVSVLFCWPEEDKFHSEFHFPEFPPLACPSSWFCFLYLLWPPHRC